MGARINATKHMPMTRREALKNTALATLVCATSNPLSGMGAPAAAAATTSSFSLPALPYAPDALEPHIDARTMEIHHGKHHAAYVANLNKALGGFPQHAAKSIEGLLKNLESLPEQIRTAVRNNGGGHYNHSLFWQMMKPKGGGEPKGDLARALAERFGSFATFKETFTDTALKVFGSGWAWLVRRADGTLAVEPSANQDSPIMRGADTTLLLGLDVWEHAYYLKYQNRRADYIGAWFNVVDWDFVARRFAEAAR